MTDGCALSMGDLHKGPRFNTQTRINVMKHASATDVNHTCCVDIRTSVARKAVSMAGKRVWSLAARLVSSWAEMTDEKTADGKVVMMAAH